MTVHEIMRHPDYERFCAEATACGRLIRPGGFPWRFMGMTDEELMRADLRFDHGTPIPSEQRPPLILCVRHNERLLVEHWQWWLQHGGSGIAEAVEPFASPYADRRLTLFG